MNEYLKDFFDNYKKYEIIKNEIKSIINDYGNSIFYISGHQKINFKIEHDKFTIYISEVNELPFALINRIIEYMGKNPRKIRFSKDNVVALTWRI